MSIIFGTMQEMSDEERKAVLGEVLMDELKAIREGIENVPTRTEFKSLDNRVSDLQSDAKVIKVVVTDMSKQLKLHERHLAGLKS